MNGGNQSYKPMLPSKFTTVESYPTRRNVPCIVIYNRRVFIRLATEYLDPTYYFSPK